MSRTYSLTVTVPQDPAAAEEAIRAALADEGFGILSEIDVQAKLVEKLGEDIGTYRILGACNPPLAHRGLSADADLGALLPCNVVIRANADGGTDIVAADPEAMLGVAGEALEELACEAKERIERALAAVAG
jgi:uncharacterized protein (DUF302 family)